MVEGEWSISNKHDFHKDCIDEWLQVSEAFPTSMTSINTASMNGCKVSSLRRFQIPEFPYRLHWWMVERSLWGDSGEQNLDGKKQMSTRSVSGWLPIVQQGQPAAWTRPCCMHPPDWSTQPASVLSSGILHTGQVQMPLHFPMFSCSEHSPTPSHPPPPPTAPGPNSKGIWPPVLEVCDTFSGNGAFREPSSGGVRCEDTESVQLALVFPCFGKRFHEAVCPVFGNASIDKTFLVDRVHPVTKRS